MTPESYAAGQTPENPRQHCYPGHFEEAGIANKKRERVGLNATVAATYSQVLA